MKYSDRLDIGDYYLIGCDTAIGETSSSSYCAIEVFSFREFTQIAELQERFLSFKIYSEVIRDVFQWVYGQVGSRIILILENNTIGRGPLEYIESDEEFDYVSHMYKEGDNKPIGINTSGTLKKQLYFGLLMEFINDNPNAIKSKKLIDQFTCIERSPSGNLKATSHNDLAMASGFCAYVRKQMAVSIMPKLQYSNEELDDHLMKDFKMIANILNPRNISKKRDRYDLDEYGIEKNIIIPKSNDYDNTFMPFFTE